MLKVADDAARKGSEGDKSDVCQNDISSMKRSKVSRLFDVSVQGNDGWKCLELSCPDFQNVIVIQFHLSKFRGFQQRMLRRPISPQTNPSLDSLVACLQVRGSNSAFLTPWRF
jgi:hypothetical protein